MFFVVVLTDGVYGAVAGTAHGGNCSRPRSISPRGNHDPYDFFGRCPPDSVEFLLCRRQSRIPMANNPVKPRIKIVFRICDNNNLGLPRNNTPATQPNSTPNPSLASIDRGICSSDLVRHGRPHRSRHCGTNADAKVEPARIANIIANTIFILSPIFCPKE